MRLRPTACGSTLRETARPSRAGAPSPSQCRAMRGSAVRRPPSKTALNSAFARTRAARGKPTPDTTTPASWADTGVLGIAGTVMAIRPAPDARPEGSDSQATTALGATARQDLAAVCSRHAGAEAVVALALEVAGLVSALGRHGGPACCYSAEKIRDFSGAAGASQRLLSSSASAGAGLVPRGTGGTLPPPRFIHRRRHTGGAVVAVPRDCLCHGCLACLPALPRSRIASRGCPDLAETAAGGPS